MAHSPGSSADTIDPVYAESWDALGALIAAGKSFSGRERNVAFLNLGTPAPSFACASGALQLDQIDDSRAVIPSDWDGDGDLDLWYANRTGPRLRFLRNDTATDGRWLALRLVGRSANPDAVGARAELTLASPHGTTRTLWRRVKAGDGFLSQTPKTLHFGFRANESIQRLVIRWPAPGLPEQIVTGIDAMAHWQLTEGEAPLRLDRPPLTLTPRPATVAEPKDSIRAALVNRLAVPPIEHLDLQGKITSLLPTPTPTAPSKPLLVLFWGSWCPRCTAEMKELAARAQDLISLRILALAVDTARPDPDTAAIEDVRRALDSRPWPFEAGFASQGTVRALAALEARALYPERDLPLPSAYLITPDGRLSSLYHGPTDVDTLIKDAAAAADPTAATEAAVFPFPGRSAKPLFPLHLAGQVQSLRDGGYLDDARAEIRRALASSANAPPSTRTQILRLLADLEDEAGLHEAAAAAWKDALALTPADPALHLALGASLWKAQHPQDALDAFSKASTHSPDAAAFHNQLGKVWQALGEHARARDAFAASLATAPENPEVTFNLAVARQFTGQTAEAIATYEAVLKLTPTQSVTPLSPASLDAASNLAWLLATSTNPTLRNPARALALAEQVNELTKGQSVPVLDNLAAAHAAAGNFASATTIATQALALATATGDTSLATDLARRLAAYKAGQAWIE
ncbi:MAG: ASPIC/UnbV domain-containing protein [Verrucomicrobiales bacterium]